MKISSKTYYGLRAMANLTAKEEVSSISDISFEENIPFHFLEKILQQLKKSGLLKASKGAFGGYALAKKPRQITVGHIFQALGETNETSPCALGNPNGSICPRAGNCTSKDVWIKLEESIFKTLDKITLADLVK